MGIKVRRGRGNSDLNATEEAWLGIDAGGTKSVAAYVCGTLRKTLASGPGNLRLLSDTQLLALFTSLRDVHADLPEPRGVAIGMASARLESDRERIRRFAEQVWPRVPCRATDDLQTALAAAELDARMHGATDYSAILITLAGTGSCFFGKNLNGQSAKVGGWGHILGDEGSAYEMGLLAMKAVVWDYDRAGVVPPLGHRLLRALMLNKPEEISAWAVNATKGDVGALAVEVAAAAAEGDKNAREILSHSSNVIAAQAMTCAGRLVKRGQRVRFVFAGSVLTKNSVVARRVARLLREQWGNADVAVLETESAWGAVELARREFARKLPAVETSGPVEQNKPDKRTQLLASLDLNLTASPTEQRNPRSMDLDRMSTRDAIGLMLSEDAKLPKAILQHADKIEKVIGWIVRSFNSGGRLFYVGAGTSGRLGVLDASECPPTFRSDPELVQGIIAGGQTALWRAAEGAEDDPAEGERVIAGRGVSKLDTVVGIAASGRTPFVWGALEEAKRHGAKTVLLTFNPHLNIPAGLNPSLVIAVDVGPEILTGSTRLKSGTATKLILNMFTTIAMVRIGKVLGNLMVDVKPTNVKLRDRAVRIVRTLTNVEESAAKAALDRTEWKIKDAVALLRRK